MVPRSCAAGSMPASTSNIVLLVGAEVGLPNSSSAWLSQLSMTRLHCARTSGCYSPPAIGGEGAARASLSLCSCAPSGAPSQTVAEMSLVPLPSRTVGAMSSTSACKRAGKLSVYVVGAKQPLLLDVVLLPLVFSDPLLPSRQRRPGSAPSPALGAGAHPGAGGGNGVLVAEGAEEAQMAAQVRTRLGPVPARVTNARARSRHTAKGDPHGFESQTAT